MDAKDRQIFELDVVEFMATAWRCKFSVVLIVLFCALVGISYGFTRPNQFTAEMQIEPLGADLIGEFKNWNALTSTYRKNIYSAEVIEADNLPSAFGAQTGTSLSSIRDISRGLSKHIFPPIDSEILFKEFVTILKQKQALIRIILENSAKFPQLNTSSTNQTDAAFDLINSISTDDSTTSFATIYIKGSDKQELRELIRTLLELICNQTIEKHLRIISVRNETYLRLINQFEKTLEIKSDRLAIQKNLQKDGAISVLTESAQIARKLNIRTPSDTGMTELPSTSDVIQDYYMFLLGYEALELFIEKIKKRHVMYEDLADPSLFEMRTDLALHQEMHRRIQIQIEDLRRTQKNLKPVVYNEYTLSFTNETKPFLFVWLAMFIGFFTSLVRVHFHKRLEIDKPTLDVK